MDKYTNGVILKRKFEDFAEVEIVGRSGKHAMLKDASGMHFVNIDKLPEFFNIVEPESILKNVHTHQNLDEAERHNISGSMNHPSDMQKYAFEKKENE